MIGEFSAVASAFLWSSTNVMMKSASDRMSVITLNALRASAGAFFVVGTLFVVGKAGELGQTSFLAATYLIAAVVIGMGIGDTLYFRSQSLVGVSRASPVSNVYPLFTLPIAFVFLGERLTWLNVAGAILIVTGVYLVARKSDSMEGLVTTAGERLRYEGLLLALTAGLCWALSTSIVKLALVQMDVFVANSIRMPAAALVLLLVAMRNGQGLNTRVHGWRPLVLGVVAGVVSIGVGGLLFLFAVQEAGAAKASTLSAIAPIFSAPLSMVFLKEKVTLPLIMGIVLSIGGVWLIL